MGLRNLKRGEINSHILQKSFGEKHDWVNLVAEYFRLGKDLGKSLALLNLLLTEQITSVTFNFCYFTRSMSLGLRDGGQRHISRLTQING